VVSGSVGLRAGISAKAMSVFCSSGKRRRVLQRIFVMSLLSCGSLGLLVRVTEAAKIDRFSRPPLVPRVRTINDKL